MIGSIRCQSRRCRSKSLNSFTRPQIQLTNQTFSCNESADSADSAALEDNIVNNNVDFSIPLIVFSTVETSSSKDQVTETLTPIQINVLCDIESA